jgi:ADP-ribose pyrophosphatase
LEDLVEETLTSSYLYRGKIVNVRQDRVRLPGGGITFREIVEHPGAVAVLAVDGRGGVVMVRQFRQAAGAVLLEVPAGKLAPGEDPLQCARRELAEETGLQAEHWEQLTWFYVSPGFCEERIYLYLARGLSKAGPAAADEDENVAVEIVPAGEARRLAAGGGIRDAKTLIALQFAGSPE